MDYKQSSIIPYSFLIKTRPCTWLSKPNLTIFPLRACISCCCHFNLTSKSLVSRVIKCNAFHLLAVLKSCAV